MSSEDRMSKVNAMHDTGNAAHMILTTAFGRWLNVAEIEALLNPQTTVLPLSTAPPSSPPPSGSLFLYNRSVTRNYKDDGYKWIKKRNSHKVREDHVKLRVGGKFRVSGCYVHGSEVPSLHRRAYHLLDPDTGTALYPVANSSNRNTVPSLVLVHYLDTKLASQHTANLMTQKNISDIGMSNGAAAVPVATVMDNNNHNTPTRNSSGRNITTSTATTSYENSIARAVPVQVPSSTCSDGSPQHQRQRQHSISMPISPQRYASQQSTLSALSRGVSDASLTPAELHESFSTSGLGLETLDFLWDVIFTEGEDKLEQTLANGNFSVNPSMIREMIDVKEEGQGQGQETFTSENGTGGSLSNQNNVQNDTNEFHTVNHSHTLGSEEEMAEIVDVTPDKAIINRNTNIVISCSEPVSNPGNDNQNAGSSFAWHTLAAFVSVTQEYESSYSSPRAISVDLFKAKRLNPYTYKTELSSITQQEDCHIIVVSVFLDSQTDPCCNGVAASIGHVLEQSWSEQSKSCTGSSSSKSWLHLSSSSHPVVKDRPFIRFLTQMSDDPFRFIAPKAEQNVDTVPHFMEQTNDLPAPAPHMAMVATALSDFPNPPVKAVLPPQTTMSFTGPNDKQQTKPLCEISDESPETKRIIQASMEAVVDESVRRSKKRANSSIEIGPSAVVDVPVAASAWASKPSNVPEIDTKAEEVDRHCKIRFVERLTDVLAEGEPSSATLVDNDEFKNMDDPELDNILDGLLVRIVESLDEISSDVKEELNVEDKSGFALLHYAALYNLPSLIPVLLSRGADPDIQTSRGNLTPLHLACGAGNAKIVELLISSGCAHNLPDSFGSYPVDHARRNGFTAVAEFLQAQIRNNALQSESLEENEDDAEKSNSISSGSSHGFEQEKVLVQSAFANLSLKDKLIFNMMVRKRRRGGAVNKDNSLTIPEEEEDDDDEEEDDVDVDIDVEEESSGHACATSENDNITSDSNGDVEMKSSEVKVVSGKSIKKLKNKARQDKSDKMEVDSVDSVISNSDKESLDIAMKLMNTEELEDIQRKSADDDEDLREWMMKRNYESLMEAKQHLQKTLTKHGEKKGKSCVNAAANDNAATVRSLKNMKSQALAGLVIRKNVTKRKKPTEQKQRVNKDEPGR